MKKIICKLFGHTYLPYEIADAPVGLKWIQIVCKCQRCPDWITQDLSTDKLDLSKILKK